MLLDRALSASAGLVALSALMVSVYQAWISRQQLKASAWPYVTQMNTGVGGWAWQVHDAGLGPALVRSMRVEVHGRPVRTWDAVAQSVLRVDGTELMARIRGVTITTSTIRRGPVLLPGSVTELLRVSPGDVATTMRRVLNDERVRVRFCYCSLYRDCWVSGSGDPEPAPVRQCPAEPALEFRS